MGSLYAKYVREKTTDEIIETDHGFATYRFMPNGHQVWIMDIYVLPDYRKSGLATEMADMIAIKAKEKKCTEILGSVVPGNANSTDSLRVLLAYGMTLVSSSDNFILFRKDI